MEKEVWKIADKIKGYLSESEMTKFLYLLVTYKVMVDFKKEEEYLREPHVIINYIQNIDMKKIEENPKIEELLYQLDLLKFYEIKFDINSIDKIFGEIIPDLKKIDFSKEIARGQYKLISEKFYEIQNILFNKSGISGYLSTPDFINKILKGILLVKETESVLDPCNGTGKMLLEVGESTEFLHGQDINKLFNEIAKINMIVANKKQAEILSGDSLLEPKFKQCDVVISNNPFGLKMHNIDNKSFKYMKWGESSKSGMDLYFLSLILSYMKDRGAIIVPEGLLFKGGKDGIVRENIIEDNLIEGVISLPNKLFTNTAITTSILILKKNKKNKKIFLMDTKSIFESIRGGVTTTNEKIKELIDIYNSKQEIKEVSKFISIEELKQNEYILTVNRYIIPEVSEKNINLKELELEVEDLETEINTYKEKVNNILKSL